MARGVDSALCVIAQEPLVSVCEGCSDKRVMCVAKKEECVCVCVCVCVYVSEDVGK